MFYFLKKYWSFTKNESASLLQSKLQIISRVFMYCIIILLFESVFKSVEKDIRSLYYVMVTQFLVMTTSSVSFEISTDIYNKKMSVFLTKPVDYLMYRVTKTLGNVLIRIISLGIIGVLMSYILTHKVPFISIKHILQCLILFIVSLSVNIVICSLIGLVAFWIREIKCLIYLNMTANFCFGGLIIPISNYPIAFQKFCIFTPYPTILNFPAQHFVFNNIEFNTCVLLGFSWFCFVCLLLYFTYKRIIKIILQNGE